MEVGDELFGRYRLTRQIARGGMGTVWEAEDLRLAQPVALKHVSFTDLPTEEITETRARTLREARMAAQLRDHPHVVSIYDVIESDGDVWLVLEYLPSTNLAEDLSNGEPISLTDIAHLGAAVADALAAAHSRGIVHRDVKPGNILIGTDRRTVKLTDFGISRALDERPVTRANVITGTPAYLAREVARGDESTPASDIFSLGATLYQAIEGNPPFGNDPNTIRQLNRNAHGMMDTPTKNTPLNPLIMRLLELDPNTRTDAATARDELHAFATRVSAPAQPTPSDRTDSASLHGAQPASLPEPMPPSKPDRRRMLLVGTAVVVALAVIAGLVVALPRLLGGSNDQSRVGVPPMPDTVGPIILTGDPRAADPCPLIDLSWLRQFGHPVTITRSEVPAACRARITTPQGDVNLDVGFDSPVKSLSDLDGKIQQLGDLTIARNLVQPKSGTNLCHNDIVLADLTKIYVQIYNSKNFDICTVVNVGTATAVNALAHDGIKYRPGRTADLRITNSNACDLLDPATLAHVPGLDGASRFPGFANWSCVWRPDRQDRPRVYLSFRLDDVQLEDYGEPTTIAGRRAWISVGTSQFNPERCTVTILTRPAPTATGAIELLQVQLDGTQPGGQVCARASELATTAANNLPPA